MGFPSKADIVVKYKSSKNEPLAAWAEREEPYNALSSISSNFVTLAEKYNNALLAINRHWDKGTLAGFSDDKSKLEFQAINSDDIDKFDPAANDAKFDEMRVVTKAVNGVLVDFDKVAKFTDFLRSDNKDQSRSDLITALEELLRAQRALKLKIKNAHNALDSYEIAKNKGITEADDRVKRKKADALYYAAQGDQRQTEKAAAAAQAAKDALARAQNESLADAFKSPIRTTFKEQCFIQANVYELIKKKMIGIGQETKLPYEQADGSGSAGNRALIVSGDPFGFMNTLTQPRSTAAIFELPDAVLSQLQPMVNLYKVEMIDEDGAEIEIPIEFPSKFDVSGRKKDTSLTSALRGSKRRGHGVGLKSFSFAYEGSDPFSVKKSISAKLQIFAAGFDEILDTRTSSPVNGKSYTYSYADLALKTGSSLMSQKVKTDELNSDTVVDKLSKLRFRLKVVLGYQMPQNLMIPSGFLMGDGDPIDAKKIKEAIYNSFTTLNLTPTTHEFKFDDSGRLNFTINYLAYVESFFDQAYFNIFSDFSVTKENFKRKMKIKDDEFKCKFPEEGDKSREIAKRFIKEDQRKSLRSLLAQLITNRKVYNISIRYDELGDIIRDPFHGIESITKAPAPTAPDVEEVAAAATETVGTNSPPNKEATPTGGLNANEHEQISFFYFSDLVDVVLGNIGHSLSESGYRSTLGEMHSLSPDVKKAEKIALARLEANFKKLRILLGPIEVRNPRNSADFTRASIGDIPVSLKYFAEWMTNKVIAKDSLSYSLSSFINDFVKNYVRNFLNNGDCYGSRTKQRISFFSANITSYRSPNTDMDAISDLIKDAQPRRLDMDREDYITELGCYLNVMGKRGFPTATLGQERETNYMVFFAGRTQPSDLMSGDITQDNSNGIFHYILGRDRGIVKTIDLTKTSTSGLRELRFEQEGFDGFQQLRDVYDANIKCFSLPSAYPGTYIFVEPLGFAPNMHGYTALDKDASGNVKNFDKYELTKYGIGGYFMIIKSEHTFAEGVAETSISARWVSGMESSVTPAGDSATQIGDNNSAKVEKCKAKRKLDKGSTPSTEPTTPPADEIATAPSK